MAKMGRPSQGGNQPAGKFTVVGFFSPQVVFEDSETWAPGFGDEGLTMPKADKRLYIQSGDSYREGLRGQVQLWRDAVYKAMTWPSNYTISPTQADGKIGEMLRGWMIGQDADWAFDLQNVARNPPLPFFPGMNTGSLVLFRLGNPHYETRQFTLFQKRRARIYGRSDRPAWRQIHDEWKTGKKFTLQTKKLKETPNERGFGKEGTEEWKDKLLRGAKSAIGRVAKDAIKSAVDKAVEEGGKRVVRKTLTKALGDRLKKIDDWTKRND